MLKQVQHDIFVALNLFQGLCLKEKEVRVKKRDAETSSA